MPTPPPDPLEAACRELRALASQLRDRGDLPAYRQAAAALMLVLAGRGTATIFDVAPPACENRHMTVTEYAARTGQRPDTIRRAAREGRLPATRHAGVWLIEAGPWR